MGCFIAMNVIYRLKRLFLFVARSESYGQEDTENHKSSACQIDWKRTLFACFGKIAGQTVIVIIRVSTIICTSVIIRYRTERNFINININDNLLLIAVLIRYSHGELILPRKAGIRGISPFSIRRNHNRTM